MADDDIVFGRGETALAAPERERVISYLLAAQRFCPLREIVVIGYADRSEGADPVRKRLAEHRAQYVAEAFHRHGAPVSVLYVVTGDWQRNYRASHGSWGGNVELHAQQSWRHGPCNVGADANGFFPDPHPDPELQPYAFH